MTPVGPVGEVGGPPLQPLAIPRARSASDIDSNQCPEHAYGGNAKPPTSPTTPTTPTAPDRWHVVCRLLAHPNRESRRLAALLTGWPHVARKHELVDDVKRRKWRRS